MNVNLHKLVATLLGALPGHFQQVVVLGICSAALLVVAYFLIEMRLKTDLPPSALTEWLPTVLDLILVILAVLAAVVSLAWLTTTLYLIYRKR